MSVVVPMGRDPHARVVALLPWFESGQLDAAETREVDAHLQTCAACQAELQTEQALRAMPVEVNHDAADVEAGLLRMRSRIRAQRKPQPAPTPSAPRWWPWLVGLQGGAIAALATLLIWPHAEAPNFRTLSAAAPAPSSMARVLVMFKPEASEAQIRAALQSCHASLMAGPTESGAYEVQLARSGEGSTLQRLRQQPGVTLVAALDPGTPQ